MIPRDTYASIPAARSLDGRAVRPLARAGRRRRWSSAPSQKQGDSFRVEVRLFGVKPKQSAFDREYTASVANPRFFAHTIADEIFQTQLALRGVARTKIAFVSDRDGERLTGTVESRVVKEIYICDYDGANQRRLTVNRTLNINPTWSPDGAVDRVHVVPPRRPRHLHLEHLPGHDARTRCTEPGRGELPAGLVAGRDEDRVPVEPRRQRGDLRDEPRRLGHPPHHQPPAERRDADLVARRATRSRSRRTGPARRRSTSSTSTA